MFAGTTGSTTYTDKSAEQGYYEYYVEAANESLSAVSESVFVDSMRPETPILSVGEICDQRVALNWECRDNVAVIRYNLYKNGSLYRTLTQNRYVDTSFSSSVENSYYVTASDAAGNISAASNIVSFVAAEDSSAPTVTGLSYDNNKLSEANSVIKVNCTDDVSLSEFVAEVKSVNSEDWKTAYRRSISKTSDIVEFSVLNSVTESGDYDIRITLKDYAGNTSVYEDTFGYVKNELVRPIISSSVIGRTAYIEWTVSSEATGIEYYLYRRYNNGEYRCIKKTNELNYTDTTLNSLYA